MQIAAPCVVSLTWRLADAQGAEIDELTEPVEFFFGGDDLLAKVEEALAGQEAGFETTLHLEPEHAFGDYDAELVFFEDARDLPGGGRGRHAVRRAAARARRRRTCRDDAIYTVTEVYPDHVVLDGNHPLAGIALRLDARRARRARGDRRGDRGRQRRHARHQRARARHAARHRACTDRGRRARRLARSPMRRRRRADLRASSPGPCR